MPFCKSIVTLFIMMFSGMIAAASFFPHGCEVTGFSFNNSYLVINENGEQSFYLIQNRSNIPVGLERFETREVFMSPPLKTNLDPNMWAAFASDIKELHFQCLIKENDSYINVNCQDFLEVCQYPRVKFALSNMGNYWVSTNKTQSQVINDAASKGIYLRW